MNPRRATTLLRGGLVPALLLSLLLAGGAAATAGATELTVIIDNVRNDKGYVRLSVYGSPEEWPDKSTKDHDQVKPATLGPVAFKFNLPPGVYAVNAFHDEKGDGKFATNFFGLPLEGYGFSNNARATYKAPSFDACAFELLPAGGVVHFNLVYP